MAHLERTLILALWYSSSEIVGVIANTASLADEALTIHEVVTYCIREQLMSPIMEFSSLIIRKVIDEDWDSPLAISMEVQKIIEWGEKGGFPGITCSKRRNQLVYSLTNKDFIQEIY